MMQIPWYKLTEDDCLKKQESSLAGLSTSDITERVSRYGKNMLPSRNRLTLFRIFLNQFINPLIYILLAAGIISIILNEYSDSGFIFLVLLINASIGTFQERKAEAKASALERMIKLKAKVKRDEKLQLIDSEKLVPGDIVILESGNKVPADLRIIKANSLTVIEAILTGESIAVNKQCEALENETIPVSERRNMLFAGTTVATGRVTGLVVSIGFETEIGKIASSLKELESGKPPLVQRMEVLTKRISLIILVACVLLGSMAYLSGISIKEIFFFSVAVMVSAIPEGLPIAVTVALSIGASQMAKRNVIIRKLTAVEGLGSCTFIATDKTGTLTVDQQTAKAIILPGYAPYNVTGEGYNGEGLIMDSIGNKLSYNATSELKEMIQSIVICNEGELIENNTNWTYAGDPIDVALLALSYKSQIYPSRLLKNIEKVSEVPFESEKRYAAVYYRKKGEKDLQIVVKGAIEKIRQHIKNIDEYNSIIKTLVRYAEEGYRVIAVGGGIVDEVKPNEVLPEIKLIGFIALIDPLRPEAKKAVKECHLAGVKVAMVTGDHPATSLSIAREVGIANHKEELITGRELAQMLTENSKDLKNVINNKRVFSRVSPHQKQIIVQSLRDSGHFIAVTGDGVNDAPALKTANIGIAMGYGTDVAKDASSIIITDNNFASIVAGIEEGRFTYSNLRKIIYFTISTGATELISIGLSLSFQLPLPFLPIQLLWLNLVTNGIQDVALAFEAGEKKLMDEPPKKPDESFFNRLMIRQTLLSAAVISLLAFGLWYHLLNHLHWEEAAARNTIVLFMVLSQNFHALNCRSETQSVFKTPLGNNHILVLGILVVHVIHILSLHIPFMQELLSLQPVTMENWIKLFFTASIIIAAMEVFKYVQVKKIKPISISR